MRPTLWAVLACACASSPATGTATAEPVRAPETPPTTARTCGKPNATLPSYAFIPDDARLALSIRLDDHGLDGAIAQLDPLGDSGDHGVPITVGFALSQLRPNLEAIRRIVDKPGFDPAEVLLLLHGDGTDAWVWHSSCDIDDAGRRFADAWDLEVRDTATGRVASRSDAARPFPFDIMFLRGELIAAVPAGKAAWAQLWLQGAPTTASLGATPLPADQRPGARLAALDPAPIRGVLAGRGLLTAGDESRPQGGTARSLRATSVALEIDGRVFARGP